MSNTFAVIFAGLANVAEMFLKISVWLTVLLVVLSLIGVTEWSLALNAGIVAAFSLIAFCITYASSLVALDA